MNHPSEWARFFDKKTGRYRYKHKGSGVIRDTFKNIGRVFKNNENNVAQIQSTSQSGKGMQTQPPPPPPPRTRRSPGIPKGKGTQIQPPPFYGTWEDYYRLKKR